MNSKEKEREKCQGPSIKAEKSLIIITQKLVAEIKIKITKQSGRIENKWKKLRIFIYEWILIQRLRFDRADNSKPSDLNQQICTNVGSRIFKQNYATFLAPPERGWLSANIKFRFYPFVFND